METISDRFRAAIADGHATTVSVIVLPDGDDTARVDISDYFADGSLDVSRQSIRRSGSMTFVDVDSSGLIVPTSSTSLLAPYGNQLRVFSGIDYGDGTTETVCVGTYRITRSTSNYPQCTVELSDRAWIVSNAKLIAPWHVASGTPWDVAVTNLLMDRYPGCPADIPPAEFDTTTPRITLDEQADPWEQMQKWVASFGYALYFSPLGVATIVGELELAAADPVWSFDGSPAASPTDLTDDDWSNMALYDQVNTWDTADAYNAVVIAGNSSSNSNAVQGIAYDTDPQSPTVWGGPFGRKPLFENNELATTNVQAARLAVGRLQQVAGLAESLQIPAVPNPAFEVGDQVTVIRPELGISTIHSLDHIPLPLRGGSQTLETRVRRVVVSGD